MQHDIPPPDQIAAYRRDGFTHLPDMLTADEAAYWRDRCLAARMRHQNGKQAPAFQQYVNIWQQDPELRELVLHPRITAWASALSGMPLRLWHDHLLIKPAAKAKPTEFHQDQPYWPHNQSPEPLSCWLALDDVPFERGCMSFIPGSHRYGNQLPAQNLQDPRSLFELAPELEWLPRVSIPLRAGGCSFHHGLTAHRAEGNSTDRDRIALAIIFIPVDTRYDGRTHIVTKDMDLEVGTVLDGPLFPELAMHGGPA